MKIKIKTQENESLCIQPYGGVINFLIQTDDMLNDKGELFESKVSVPIEEIDTLINYLNLIKNGFSLFKVMAQKKI